MRSVRCIVPGPEPREALRIAEVAPPEPSPGEVLIAVQACAVCRTDLQIVSGDLQAHQLPVTPGHQVVGVIEQIGATPAGAFDPPPLHVGQRVGLVWLAGTCGTCRFCRSDRENLCLSARFTGWDRDGGFATHVTARAEFVHPIPDLGPAYGSDPQASAVALAPLLCGGVIGYRALGVAGIGPDSAGMRLGLYGFGASATIALQLARHFGVQTYVITRSAAEVSRALALGADWAGTYDQPPRELLDAAVTFAPSGEVVLAALRACDRGAPVAINAIHLDGIPAFDYDDLWWERSLRSVANVTRRDVREFLDLVGPAGIRTQAEALPLTEAALALTRLRTGDVHGALVLVPD